MIAVVVGAVLVSLLLCGVLVYLRREDRRLLSETTARFQSLADAHADAQSHLATVHADATKAMLDRVLATLAEERAHVERVVAVSKAGSYAETQPGYMDSMARQAEAAARIEHPADPMDEAMADLRREADDDLEKRFGPDNLASRPVEPPGDA